MKKAYPSTIKYICSSCGRGVDRSATSHSCSATDQQRVKALVETIPKEVKGKLIVALLKEQKLDCSPGTSKLALPQAHGGPPLEVTVGPTPISPVMEPLTVKEVQVMAGKAHLTGAQSQSVVADLRSHFGR